MEAFSRYLDGYCHVHVQLWEHLRAKTFAALEEHTRQKEALSTAADVRARGDKVRALFLESLGGLPSGNHPLNARTVGVIPRDGYTIERVIFESEPKVYVTALFYLPARRSGRIPAVLFVCGHHRDAKCNPEYQRVCHDLVINGFAVLAIDPTGQGERITHLDPDTGKEPIGWGTSEHSYHGQQCILTGTSIARYFLFDAMRGIDYLQSRPEVDGDRIGVTGNSGGGTQTSLLCMSGDPRVKAAVPCTYVTSREHYYLTGQPQDAEQIQFGMTKNGINFDDMFLPFAPRPLLIGAVESDFFSPEGTALTYERLRRIYKLMGEEDKVGCVFAPGMHKYCKGLREAAVNWFRRHLLGAEPNFVSTGNAGIPAGHHQEDEQIDTLPGEKLWCTSKGHVATDFPGARSPYHRDLEMIPKRSGTRSLETLRGDITKVLCIHDRIESPSGLFPRTLRSNETEGLLARSVYFRSEPGIMVAGCLLQKANTTPAEAVIVLTETGTRGLDQSAPLWRPIVDEGRAAFVFDVRGTGSVESDPISAYGNEYPSTFFNTNNWMAFLAYCVGDCLLGMRVFDVLRAAAYLRGNAGFTSLGLRAQELAPALWGYLAAALDPSIRDTAVDGLIESFEAVVRTPFYRLDFTPALLVHGVLKAFDLPDLKVFFEGRKLTTTPASVEMV